jgi:hypothetical protein
MRKSQWGEKQWMNAMLATRLLEVNECCAREKRYSTTVYSWCILDQSLYPPLVRNASMSGLTLCDRFATWSAQVWSSLKNTTMSLPRGL